MPYISNKNRESYASCLKKAVGIILDQNSLAKRAEMLGWWANHLAQGIVHAPSETMDTEGGSALKEQADRALSILLEPLSHVSDEAVFSLSGNLNYCISYVLWGVLDPPGLKSASYGMRCYSAQQIRNVSESHLLKSKNMISLIVKGAIHDVLDEVYRRKTAAYEDAKIVENGDLF